MRYVLNNHWPFDLVPPQGHEGSVELNGFTDDHALNKGFNPSVKSAELFTKQVKLDAPKSSKDELTKNGVYLFQVKKTVVKV